MQGEGAVRPLRKGDLFCYAPPNPVEVKSGLKVEIEIPCYPKADRFAFVPSPKVKKSDNITLYEMAQEEQSGITGHVLDSMGNPVSGVYVVAYKTTTSSTPTYEAENIAQTDAAGRYFIPLNTDGNYGLVVRERLGTAPKSNDISGLYGKDPWKGIAFKAGELKENINITITEEDRKLFE